MRSIAGLAGILMIAVGSGAGATDCRDAGADCTLRAAANEVGVYYGAAIKPPLDSPGYLPAFTNDTNSITAENHLKWNVIHPAPGAYDFTVGDQLVDFAEANGMRVRGHALIWDQALIDSTPAYVTAITDPAELRALLAEHIQTVVGRYRGRIETWDVVNEPLETGGATLYDNVFHHVLGPGYVAEALHLAHAADPDAVLVVNEVLVERSTAKFAALVALAEDLLAQGAPLHGIGIQGHFFAPVVPEELQANIEALAALGLRVELTEVDVPLRGSDDLSAKLARQRDEYRQIAAACMAVPACMGITTWGITDARTWLDSFLGPGLAPLPLDESYARKPAYFGLRDGILARGRGTAVAGQRLALRDGRRPRLAFSVRDAAVSPGGGSGSADDPTVIGGSLRIVATNGDAFDVTYPLPAAGWAPLGSEGSGRGWVYASGGPIRKVRVRPGIGIDAVGAGEMLGHSLGAEPDRVDVMLTIGAQRYCARFGGERRFVTSRRFVAKRAAAPIGCNALD